MAQASNPRPAIALVQLDHFELLVLRHRNGTFALSFGFKQIINQLLRSMQLIAIFSVNKEQELLLKVCARAVKFVAYATSAVPAI